MGCNLVVRANLFAHRCFGGINIPLCKMVTGRMNSPLQFDLRTDNNKRILAQLTAQLFHNIEELVVGANSFAHRPIEELRG